MNYSDVDRLMSNRTFKDKYRSECDIVMKYYGTLHSQWVLHPKNGMFGLKDQYGNWCWRNTINTHPNCFLSLYNFYINLGGEEIDFFDDNNMTNNIQKFWTFIGDRWEFIFTDDIQTKYFHELRLKTNKSWSKGQVTTISFLYVFRDIFTDSTFKKISFSLERGDISDFKGIDVELLTTSNEQITVQVKSGTFDERTNCYKVQSSINDLRSKSSHYCFVDMENLNIIVFKNDVNLIENYPNFFLFQKELYVNNVTINNMSVPNKLHEILTFCAENKIVFDLMRNDGQKNSAEFVFFPESVITINISDYKDENLYNLLDEKYKELQQLLN